jgi:hypothetical protein
MIFKENSTIPLELRIVDMIGQEKTDIASVSVRVYHRVAGVITEDLAPTAMLGSGSSWYYSYVSSLTTGKYIVEYTITDNSAEVYIQTEELVIGYLETEIELIKQVETGRWKIDQTSNQMIFYKDDNTTELFRCNLFDINGNPSPDMVTERRRV